MQLFGNEALIVGQYQHDARQPKTAALPGRASRRTDCQIAIGHQVRHVDDIHPYLDRPGHAHCLPANVSQPGRRRSHHHADPAISRQIAEFEGLHYLRGAVVLVDPTHADQQVLQLRLCPTPQAVGAQVGEFGAQQSKVRSTQHRAGGRHPRPIILDCAAEGLVQQQVTLVPPVGQVVDRHQLAIMRPKRGFPARIQGVMVDDQPVGMQLGQNRRALHGILLLSGT